MISWSLLFPNLIFLGEQKLNNSLINLSIIFGYFDIRNEQENPQYGWVNSYNNVGVLVKKPSLCLIGVSFEAIQAINTGNKL